ncbi:MULTISPECIES: CDP-alcohol phosphatidyltransferase family protein [Pseudanabaena]|jgi:CDP-diacylglycerol---glycerol-3-phosphate 3-phosphatidyltransferase|uniref:CDP-alcohol phosphatidyltransferase family protein n=1 Tax=Pseudanabaena TaxID=1152 RepID=UPI00247990B9|nr:MULTISPECIES: CDP-alcohol phosphatidyltransferase family protein [Pseudanabaena]MEA5489265.1 CDP-alcohol phosphatidyltransferase family protein [Pseudanabaena sp. CCNP1317]WGS73484.1 CDP-alcohol phosphatidyltransferase family protein [Pseudanabaena galeata CCNP1313]
MISVYQCKSVFQNLLRPLVQQLATWQISPNQVTISAILLSGVTGLALVQSTQFASSFLPTSQQVLCSLPIALLARMALNAIDGMLAREHGQKSALGCILNEMGDVLSDIFLYLPFALIAGVSAPLIVSIVILAIASEMVGVLGYEIDHKRHYEGPMGKSDRALVFGVIGLILGLGIDPNQWLTFLLVAVILLQIWTITNRIQGMLQEVEAWK